MREEYEEQLRLLGMGAYMKAAEVGASDALRTVACNMFEAGYEIAEICSVTGLRDQVIKQYLIKEDYINREQR